MLTYTQLLKGKGSVRKQLWLICGDEPALIQDAIELAKDHVYSGVSTVCLGVFFGTDKSQTALLDFLDMPHFEERKLAIVHDSEHLDEALLENLKSIEGSTFVVLVHNGVPDSDDPKVKLLTNNKIGRSVKCNAMTPENVKMWVRSRLNISDTALNTLTSKFHGDYEWLLNKIRVLEQLNLSEISPFAVEKVCFDIGIQRFEKSLIEFDKEQCFLYIKDRELNAVNLKEISNDTYNLSVLQTVVGQHSQQLRPLADKTGLTRKELEYYMDKISYYDLPESQRCFNALTSLHRGLVANDRSAFLSLVCRW